MSIALINTTTGSDYSGTTTNSPKTSAASLTAGNLQVAALSFSNPGNTVVISGAIDTASNLYANAITNFNAATACTNAMYYIKNANGNASNIITFFLSNFVPNWGICGVQYSGLDTQTPLDTTASGTASAATTVTSGAFSTANPDEVLISFGRYDGASGLTWTPDTGYTVEVQDASAVTALEDKIVSSLQAGVTASMTISAARNIGQVVAAFKQKSIFSQFFLLP